MKRYGLVGYQLGYSFSKKFFTDKFSREGLHDFSYENFELKDISEFPSLIQDNPNLAGLNITIPYKEDVVQFLHEESDTVKECKACNCIKIEDGKLIGYNTDVYGFTKAFSSKLKPSQKKALILGTGGASKAIKFSLEKLNIDYLLVSRTRSEKGVINYDDIDEKIIDEYRIIINTTPVGTFPDVDNSPVLPYQFLTAEHYLFDLVYNPEKTRFMQLGEEQGATIQNGFTMLELQAEESWRIWNS